VGARCKRQADLPERLAHLGWHRRQECEETTIHVAVECFVRAMQMPRQSLRRNGRECLDQICYGFDNEHVGIEEDDYACRVDEKELELEQ